MKKVLLSFMAIAAGATIAMAQDPVFPETIDYTINGEKELAGVDVVTTDNGWGPEMSITGKSDAETITITLALPDGWDGWIVNTLAEVSEQSTAKTRGEYDTLDFYLSNLEYQKGNTVTFVVGEDDWATFALYKDDQVFETSLSIEFDVTPAGGVVSTDPVFPESVGVTIYAEGVYEEQNNEDGEIFIGVYGESQESTFDVILDVPEGWTGFISMPDSEDVTISENNGGPTGPRMRKVQEAEWVPIESVMNEGIFLGNKFTFPANGSRQKVEVHLYKDDMVDVANFITLTANVKKYVDPELAAANQAAYEAAIDKIDAFKGKYEEAVEKIKGIDPDFDFSEWDSLISEQIEQAKQFAEMALNAANEEGLPFANCYYGGTEGIEYAIAEMLMIVDPAPEFPSTFDVALSSYAGVKLTADDSWGVFAINVTGKSIEDEITITVDVPEGFDGFVHMRDLDITDPGIGGGPLSTRSEEPYWLPLSIVLEDGCKEGNTMTFPVDGILHSGQFFPYKNGLVDVNNQINVEFEVEDFRPTYEANLAAYDEVMNEINAANAKYTEAVEFIKGYNPKYDMTEMQEIIKNAISEAQTGAEQALIGANEEGEEFFYPFSAEEINAMIAEMRVQAVKEPNKAAYDETLAAIEKSEAEYEKTLKELKDANPDFDFKEWEEIIEYVLNDAKKEAEKALDTANENGTAYEYAYDGKEIEALLKEMSEEVKTSGIAGVNAADNASYYDLNGNKINNPKAGMYIKVVDGKASKVVLK